VLYDSSESNYFKYLLTAIRGPKIEVFYAKDNNPIVRYEGSKTKSKDNPITLFDGGGLFLMVTLWKAIRKRSWPSAHIHGNKPS